MVLKPLKIRPPCLFCSIILQDAKNEKRCSNVNIWKAPSGGWAEIENIKNCSSSDFFIFSSREVCIFLCQQAKYLTSIHSKSEHLANFTRYFPVFQRLLSPWSHSCKREKGQWIRFLFQKIPWQCCSVTNTSLYVHHTKLLRLLSKAWTPHGNDVCSMQGVPQWRLWAP